MLRIEVCPHILRRGQPQHVYRLLFAFGTAGTGPGEFTEPWSIAVAPSGDVYVVAQSAADAAILKRFDIPADRSADMR